jgi:heme exporter protein A
LQGQDDPPPSDNAGYEIRLEKLFVIRGERLIFRDLSLAIQSGAAVVLAGPNGSGKTTLLRVLAGLIRPTAGRVLWQGKNALEDLTEHGERVAYVGHQDAIKPGLTVAENLAFAAAVSRRPIAAALDSLRLTALAAVPGRQLSAGQKRRVALTRLMLSNAPLWLLDEPTLGLDTASIDRFGEILAAHRKAGGMVVAATHIPLPMSDVTEVRFA